MHPLRWFDARFLAPAPAERLASVRLLTGAFAVCYLLIRAPVLADFRAAPGRFQPVGLAAVLDAPLPAWLVFGLYGLCVLGGVAFTLGLRYRLVGPLFALLLLWVTSYRNSWGMVFHTDNLLVLHVIVLACSDAAAALSWDVRRGAARSAARSQAPGETAGAGAAGRFGWPLRLMSALTAVAYVLAAVAKLKITGIGWADGEVLRDQIAYDALRKSQIGSVYSPLAACLVQVQWPYPILSWLTLGFELMGPFVLWNRALSLLWAAGLWSFHLGVLLSMAIAFPYPLSGVAFASLLRCERLWHLRPLAPLRQFLIGPALQAEGARVKLAEP